MDQKNPAISNIIESLGLMRLGASIARQLPPDGQMILVHSTQTWINEIMDQVDGEDFTEQETHTFLFDDVLQCENPYEAAYILQQKVLSKTSAHPEKFRDPDPLRTVKDVRNFSSEQREAYMAGLRGEGIF